MPRLSRSEVKIESLLAFAFGTVFSGILAYASLQSTPILGPNFFFLKVLSALSAAGVAAVIPGMINVDIGKGALVGVRAAGAIAVFLLVFMTDPPAMVSGDERLRAQMQSNFAALLLDDAERQADELLRKKSNDAEALNIKGGIAFYRGRYGTAASFFRRAHQEDPTGSIIASNYANALVETGDYEKAIELFRSIDDGRPDRAFTLGRAYFYAGEFSDANSILERVPQDYWKGAGKVVRAGALLGVAEMQPDGTKKESFLVSARQRFREGYYVDRIYWDGIFKHGQTDVHLPHDRVVSKLKPIYDQETTSP